MKLMFLHICLLCCCSGYVTGTNSSNILEIDSFNLPEIRCPCGHHITVVAAHINCNSGQLDVYEEVWDLCAYRSSCMLNPSIYKRCNKSPHFEFVKFSCIKCIHTHLLLSHTSYDMLGYDCGLFYGVDMKDDEMCQMLCLNYVRSCTSRYDLVPREYYLKCLSKMFLRNNVKECEFLPDSKMKEFDSFKLEYYLKPKYILESVEINNYEWTELKYKEPIENPIVIVSPVQTVDNVVVIVNNVTQTSAKLILQSVVPNNSGVSRTKSMVEVLIITIGNHSVDLNKQIVVGLIEVMSDQFIKLPLDPLFDWVVVLKNQTDAMVNPILHENNTVKFYTQGPVTRVKLGYLALNKSKDKSMLLYENELKYDQTNVKQVKLSPNTRLFVTPIDKPNYNTVYNITFTDGSDVTNIVYTKENTITLISHYNTFLTRFKVLDSVPVTFNIITLESSVIIWIKRICEYSRRVNLISKRNCYHQCINSSYLKDCLQGDTNYFFTCYKSKSENCEILNLSSLLNLILKYRNDILTHFFNANTNVNNTNTVNKVDSNKNVDNTDRDKPTGNVVDTVKVINTNNVNKLDGGNGTNNLLTVYSEWSDWSECSKICNDDVSKSIKVRKRLIYYPGQSDADQTIQAVECHKVINCNKLCYYRVLNSNNALNTNKTVDNTSPTISNSNSDKTVEKAVKYFFVWNVNCMMKREKIDLGGKLISSVSKVDEILEYDENCDLDFNYSACDTPPGKGTGNRHLLINIKCPKTTKPCERPDNNNVKPVDNRGEMCLMYNGEYDGKSWVKNGSCICPENTIPYPHLVIHMRTQIYRYVYSISIIDILMKNVIGIGMQEYISLSGHERLVVPLGYIKVPTFDFFTSESQLENYCSNGNINYSNDQLTNSTVDDQLLNTSVGNELLYVSCDNVILSELKISTGLEKSNLFESCISKCKELEKECENEIDRFKEVDMIKCLKEFVKESNKFDVIVFKNYFEKQYKNVEIDEIITVIHLIDAICIDDKLYNLCVTTLKNILNDCKNILNHDFQNKVKKCLHKRMNEDQSKNGVVNCKFNKERKIIGNGLVYCKEITCKFTEYSKWISNQSNNNNQTDELYKRLEEISDELSEENIMKVVNELGSNVKIRFRKVVSGSKHCYNINKLVQIYPNTSVAQVEPPNTTDQDKFSRIILNDSNNIDSNTSNIVDNDNNSEISSKTVDLIDNNGDRVESNLNGINCRIYLGQKQIQNTKLIIQRNRCSCPYKMNQCSIEESLKSKDWNKQLSLVCNNKMRSILFLNRNSFYRYSCLSLSYIKEDFESVKELCNEDDGMTFISCYGETSLLEVYLMASFMAFLGITSSCILLIYLHKIKHISFFN
ncbi:uncharacterized protein TA14215 [Theileria annulata]|uniref:Uncharacterized protein n=1 Tax=Theileria annulata TaxID=5874 RepID=Q4UEX9_THEAN|nr:uncharacterized protein TA14215 [Theileria annulata]CAI74360.1 hypothetical protein TA14215 [Theileria annulata]|eukprot:XP_952092.1 hypothetical protein TA14215 [Theileria annulata]